MMKKLFSSLSVVQKTIQTGFLLILSLLFLAGGWFVYSFWSKQSAQQKKIRETKQKLEKKNELISSQRKKLRDRKEQLERKDQKISHLQTTVKQKEQEINQLQTQIRLLKVTRRVARLRVIEQYRDSQTDSIHTTLEFVELDDNGTPIGNRINATVEGKIVYVDGWIVKFKDKYVQKSELPRSSSVILFHRIYGQKQSPESGIQLDDMDSVPHPYRGKKAENELIEQIFRDFWSVANSKSLQNKMGIRAAHGTAGYIKAETGKTYRVSLRASGDVSIFPTDSDTKKE